MQQLPDQSTLHSNELIGFLSWGGYSKEFIDFFIRAAFPEGNSSTSLSEEVLQ